MLKTPFSPKAGELSALATFSKPPKVAASRPAGAVAMLNPKSMPAYVSLRVNLGPETVERFTNSVTELAPALDMIGGKEPYVAGGVLAALLLDAAQKTGASEKAKLDSFRDTVNYPRFNSIYVTGLPIGEAEAEGEIYDMRRAALLGLAFYAGLTPPEKAINMGEQTPRFDQMTAPVFTHAKEFKPQRSQPLYLKIWRRQPTTSYVLSESLPKSEGAAELIPPQVLVLAGTLPMDGAEVRLTPFSNLVRTLTPYEKSELFKPHFVIKEKAPSGEETAMALPLAMPGMMNSANFIRKIVSNRGEAKGQNLAMVLAGFMNDSAFRLDTRVGMVRGLTSSAERVLEKWRMAAVVKGEEAPRVFLKQGEALFVNNYRMLHRTGGETEPNHTALVEKMSLEGLKRPSQLGR